QSMLLLLGAVLLVMGAALANLVALVLIRTSERRAELSIRIAVGARRGQLIRQLMVESLLLAFIGSGLGCLFAIGAIAVAVPRAPSSIPRLAEVGIDGKVLGYVSLLAIAATTLLTISTNDGVRRASEGDALHLISRGALGDRSSGRLRQALVIGELACALVLLLTTSVQLRNVRRLQDVQPGFSPDPVFQARISIPTTYKAPDDVARFYDQLTARLTSLPGVKSAGVTSVAPLSGLLRTVPFTVEAETGDPREI